jgi:hypothetical protein
MKSISGHSPQIAAMNKYYILNVWSPGCTVIFLEWVFDEYRATFDRGKWAYVFERDEDYTWFIF